MPQSVESGSELKKMQTLFQSFWVILFYNFSYFINVINDVNSDGTMKRAYRLQNITSQQLNAKGSGNALAPSHSTADISIIADLHAFVKRYDKNFNPQKSRI